jgi:hypothetical protein
VARRLRDEPECAGKCGQADRQVDEEHDPPAEAEQVGVDEDAAPFLTAGDGQVRFEFGLSVLVAGLDSLKHWTPDQRDST